MGNCIDSCRVNEGGAEEAEKNNNIQCESRISRKGPERRIQSYPCGERNDRNRQVLKETVKGKSSNNNNNNGKRVKMVLTKEELQWLMLQLKNREIVGNNNNKNNNYKRIEDVLLEIEKGRKKLLAQNWKPSLDSIYEHPE